jgi:large subunit ribosomal protein L6
MSRIGRQPINVPAGVLVSVDPGRVTVSGPKGELRSVVPQRMKIEQEDGVITVSRPTERGEDRALHGLTRTLVANMVEGVTNGFEKRLEIQGVGYRAAMSGTNLELQVGYSHPVRITPRQGIEFEVPAPTQVIVRGIDKQMVGQTAAEIRKVRPPEPYKGKGIRYEGEYVRSNRGIFAQLVDDSTGRTLAGAGWTALKDFEGDKTAQAKQVGKELAAAAKDAGIKAVVFDRGGYLYHGRVKALAEGAREGGLRF